jgi:Short C-terminal domain
VNTLPLRKFLSLSVAFVAFGVTARASNPNVDVSAAEDLGDSTLKITVEAKSAFDRNVNQMKMTAREAAEGYCAAHNKQLRVVSVDGNKPIFATGYTTATIVFKALDASAPELAPTAPAIPAAAPVVTLTATTDDLYTALTKLDDLRKKGILTDDEFQAEKKKLLSHTN